jgi:hypothetical protein
MSYTCLFSKPAARLAFIALLALIVLLAACNGGAADGTRSVSISEVQVTIAAPGMEPFVFQTSEPGTITVHGLLLVLSPMSIIPAHDDAIYLVPLPADQPVTGIPPFETGTVPQAEVDERTGEFTFTNIQPGQYAVVVITAGGAQIPARYRENASYAIFTLDASQADTTFELNQLTLP